MRILFDQGIPAPLRRYLTGHTVATSYEKGWSDLKNGELLDAAERDGFELLLTTDKNLRYQQNLQTRRLAILALPTTSWPVIEPHAGLVLATVNSMGPGEYRQIIFPP